MGLLDPAALWLLLPVALVLALRLRKRQKRLQQVSFLDLWHTGGESPRRRLLLRTDPLLLQQVLFALLIVLALAGPVLPTAGGRRVTFVFDASASMTALDGGRQRFDLARERAVAILESLESDDQVQLVLAGRRPRAMGGFLADRQEVRRRIMDLEPLESEADVDASLMIAYASTAGRDDGPVYLLTDGAANAQPSPGLRLPRLRFEHVGGPADNVGITRFSARPSRISPYDHDLFVEVLNASRRRRAVALTIRAGARAILDTTVELEPGQRSSVVAQGVAVDDEVVVATLGIEDALAVDNEAYLVVERSARIRVLLVGEGGRFLDAALAVDPRVELTRTSPEGLSRALESVTFDVVVLDRVGSVPVPGDRLLVFPSGRDGARVAALETPVTARDHPLGGWSSLGGVYAGSPIEVPLRPGGRALLETEARRPVIAAWQRGTRREVTVGLDPASPAWGRSVSYPVFMANAIRWLADSEEHSDGSTRAGNLVVRHLAIDGSGSGVSIEDPRGSLLTATAAAGRLTFADTERTGIYTLRGPGFEEKIAVNLASASESDLEPSEPPSEPGPARLAGGGGGAPSEHRTLSRLLLIAALLVLLLQWLMGERRGDARV